VWVLLEWFVCAGGGVCLICWSALLSGSFATATCMVCQQRVDADCIRDDIMNQVRRFILLPVYLLLTFLDSVGWVQRRALDSPSRSKWDVTDLHCFGLQPDTSLLGFQIC